MLSSSWYCSPPSCPLQDRGERGGDSQPRQHLREQAYLVHLRDDADQSPSKRTADFSPSLVKYSVPTLNRIARIGWLESVVLCWSQPKHYGTQQK